MKYNVMFKDEIKAFLKEQFYESWMDERLRLGEVRAMTVTSAGLYICLALYFTPYFAKPFVRRLLRLVITI